MRDGLGAGFVAAMDEHHVGVFFADLVEDGPDADVVVEVETSDECDLGALGQEYFGFGAALGGDVVTAVDHGRGHGPAADHGARAGAPGRTGAVLVLGGRVIAQAFESGVLFEKVLSLVDQVLELDRADFGTVLFLLCAALLGFVFVEEALDAVKLAVEEVAERPEEALDVRFKRGVGKGVGQGGEKVGDDIVEGFIGGERALFLAVRVTMDIAVECKIAGDAAGGGDGREARAVSETGHGLCPSRCWEAGALPRPFWRNPCQRRVAGSTARLFGRAAGTSVEDGRAVAPGPGSGLLRQLVKAGRAAPPRGLRPGLVLGRAPSTFRTSA
ncbi:protein of unknown function [Candidatus Filomicrobium marinum]|nr:protein of unknown function [Candidatus Filomicrobium marinum]